MKLFLLKEKHAFLILSVLFILAAIPRINFPDLSHGDEYADANVLNAGENFARFGFIKCKFLPVFKLNLNSPLGQAYTHYPPLPEIINGLLRIVFRDDSLYFFRSISIFCSFLNLLFWYLFIKLFTKDYLVSLICAVFYLSNPLFIFGMDSLHEACYSELLRSVIFFMLILFTGIQKRKAAGLFFLWALVFFESLITFEYIIYFCLFFIVFKVIFNSWPNYKLTWREAFFLLLAPVFGFLLHFLQNVWYFGSFSSAVQDLTRSAFRRIVCDNNFTIDFGLWLREVVLKNFSITFLFESATLLLFVFVSSMLYIRFQYKIEEKDKRLIASLAKLLLIFIACGVSWYLFFPLHSYDHNNIIFLARHLLPAAAIAFTIWLYAIYILLWKNNAAVFWQRFLLLIIPIALGIFIIIRGINQSQLPITPEKISWEYSFLMLKEDFLFLKKISKNNDIIGTTIFRNPNISYYTHRQCQFI